ANTTRGAVPSTTPSFWSCTPGPTPEPATPPPPPPNSRLPRPRELVTTTRSLHPSLTESAERKYDMRSAAEQVWTAEQTALYLQIPKATLYQWRYLGIGPKAGRVRRHLRYDPDDVKAWFRQQQEAACAYPPPGTSATPERKTSPVPNTAGAVPGSTKPPNT